MDRYTFIVAAVSGFTGGIISASIVAFGPYVLFWLAGQR